MNNICKANLGQLLYIARFTEMNIKAQEELFRRVTENEHEYVPTNVSKDSK